VIAVIDYGAGNLRSVASAFEAIGQHPLITNQPGDLAKAAAIVLPGVGAFGDGMESLRRFGLIETLQEEVLEKKKPYLGICLGLQFLGLESLEHGAHAGLGWLKGLVRQIVPNDKRFRIPHIGWNNIHIQRPSPLFEGLPPEPVFYFVHSFHLEMAEAERAAVTSTCWHGADITASVQKDHIFAVQFHPEKSQENGLKLLENFVRLI
jgi:imidazole glycerol-phosphate synthase subunit HisH